MRAAKARARPAPQPAAPPPAAPQPREGVGRFLASFRYAWDGVVETALHQRNMRVHLVAALLVALVGSGVRLGVPEELALALCVFLVLSAEVANSALEALVDLVTRERHDLARRAKDAGAGAVLVLAAGSVAVLALVVVRAWPAVAAHPDAVARQAALGAPLVAAASLLLAPFRRPRGVDAALVAAGAGALAALAWFTVSAPFTALAALAFAVAAETARRRARAGPARAG